VTKLAVDQESIDNLIDWLVNGARPSANARDIVDGICTRLHDAGIPVERFVLFVYTLHPNLMGRRFRWQPGVDVDMAEAPVSTTSSVDYRNNPLPHVLEAQTSIRRKLCDKNCPQDYLIVEQLRDDGLTDYLIQPLVFTTGETHACSWSTKQQGGFDDEMIEILERVAPHLARLSEAYMLRLNAATLLSTYVGRNVGERILNGAIHRGDGEEISAIILFVDIKNFTSLSNSMQSSALLNLLNDTFDALVPPIEEAGGEILKFMGDGFFAIFPFDGEHDVVRAGHAALDAVKSGKENIALLEQGLNNSYRSALHFGGFHYGNIGGANRLDFTAIGSCVNFAARLLSAGTELDADQVISAELAKKLGISSRLGQVNMKGFDGLQTVHEF
jgi:adenylate cyclase